MYQLKSQSLSVFDFFKKLKNMTTLDNHIISSLDSLTDEGRNEAIKLLGKSTKIVMKESDSLASKQMFKSLFINKKKHKI